MTSYEIDIQLQPSTFNIDLVTPFITVGGGGVTIHNETTGRDAADAHPQGSVTGLVDALDEKQDKAIIQSITIPAADWVADEQTVVVSDVTADNEVDIIIETQINGDLWADANIYVISQGVDTLTFTCETTPTDDIQIKVRIWL